MKSFFPRILAALQRGHRFVTHDVWRLGKPGEEIPHGLIIKHIRVAILVFRNLTRDVFWLRASALAFTTLLSIVPFFAVMFYVIQTFNLEEGLYNFVAERVRSRIQASVQESFVDTSAVQRDGVNEAMSGEGQAGLDNNGETDSTSPDDEPPLKDVLIEWVFQNVAQRTQTEKGEFLQDPVRALIAFAERSANPHAIGIPGLFLVLAAVFSLMINIEMAFNSIWGVKPTRSWFRIVSDYLVIMLMLPFIAAAVLGLTVAFQGRGGEAVGFLLRAVRFVVVWVSFSLLYFVVPNTRVRYRYAFIGGVVGGTAWIILAWVYVSLVSLTGYRMVYASFAQFPLLVVWIYMSWVIVLFGAQLTFAYQNERTFALERLAANASYAYRETVALSLMLEMARRFDTGLGGLEPSASGAAWNIPMSLVNQSLDHLETAGLIRRCATEPPTYLPSRSLDRITVKDVIDAVRNAGEEPSALREAVGLQPLLGEMERLRHQSLSRTLASAIREPVLRIPGIDVGHENAPPSAPDNEPLSPADNP